MDFLSSGTFWIGALGLIATTVTAVVGQVAQSRRHFRELDAQRRRDRHGELKDAYLAMGDVLTRMTGSAESTVAANILMSDLSVVPGNLAARNRLRLLRAPDSVTSSVRAFGEEYKRTRDANFASLLPEEKDAIRERLRDLEGAFYMRCGEHLASIWAGNCDDPET